MRFADPQLFLLVLLVIPIIFWVDKQGGRIRFSNIELLKRVRSNKVFHPRSWLTFLRVLSLIFLILAVGRPQSGRTYSEVTSEGVDIFLALDTSGSMNALDFQMDKEPVNRLAIVKKVVEDFIDKRSTDRLGLIIFGDEAFTQCPLTLDHGILMDFLKEVEIGMVGKATAIGSAIGTGVKRMKDLKAKSKILILLTDGRNTAGRLAPVKAAEVAQSFGIKIYTIGVGKRGKAPFLVDGFFGKRYVYQKVDIDEETLKEVAKITGGRYYRATDTEELKSIYDEIDRLEKTKIEVKEYTEYNEKFHYFIFIGLLLLLLEVFLGQTVLRKIP